MNVEQQLLRSCIKKDRAAQYELYKRCYSFMMGICLRYVNDKSSAAALMNEGFLKVIVNLEKYKPHIPFELWVRRIMINTLVDDYRKNIKMKETIEYNGMDGSEYEKAAVMNDAVGKMNLEQIQQFILKLPGMSRRVFNLFAVDGYSHKEIADMLEISEGTSKWHVSTARQKLQEMIIKYSKSKEFQAS